MLLRWSVSKARLNWHSKNSWPTGLLLSKSDKRFLRSNMRDASRPIGCNRQSPTRIHNSYK